MANSAVVFVACDLAWRPSLLEARNGCANWPAELAGVSGMRDLMAGGGNVLRASRGGYNRSVGGNATGQARHFAASAFAYVRYGGPIAHLGFAWNESYRPGANREDYVLSIRAFEMTRDLVLYSRMGTQWTPDGMGKFVENWIATKVCAR